MIKVTEDKYTLKISRDGEPKITLRPTTSTTLKISSVGRQGLKGDTPTPTDTQVLQDASQGASTPTYDGVVEDKLIRIDYVDANGATGHQKVLSYGTVFGEEVVTSIVSTFVYEGETWTYTKTLNYIEFNSAPLWNGTTPTISKV